MPSFGSASMGRLRTCHPDIQKIMGIVIMYYDCSILEGHRDKETQMKAFNDRRSKVSWPDSKHNIVPSMAVDVVPYPINWGEKGTQAQRRKAIARFYYLAGIIQMTANLLDIKIRWGGDWDGDYEFSDQSFDDLPHFELVLDN